MLHSTLHSVRRLVGFACRGVPFAESEAPARATAGPKLIYRLTAWPQLPDAQRTADIYRLLSVMSHRPVTRQWMLDRFPIHPQRLDALLQALCDEGAVEVIDPARFAGREPARA